MKFDFRNPSVTGGLKISKAQQTTLGIVGLTAVVVGAGLVLVINFSKYIDFNNKVITKQGEAISGYSAESPPSWHLLLRQTDPASSSRWSWLQARTP